MTPAGDDDEKLVPEWRVGADEQIILVGVAVFAAMIAFLAWTLWQGDGDETAEAVAGPLTSLVPGADPGGAIGRTIGPASPIITTSTPTTEAAAATTTEAAAGASTTATTAEPTTTAPVIGDVRAAVSDLPGAITGGNDGSTAILQGFVANEPERAAAEVAAAAVDGIDTVDNQLVVLEPLVATALEDGGVVDGAAEGVGTSLTVTGTLQSEDDRAPVIAAAESVEGVTEIIDELTVSVAADINALPQVQFATASARILPESFADLDAAAELIKGADGVELRVEGYTDIIGDASANRRLSNARANAVLRYLVDAGVDPARLTAEGFGETEQFGAGNSDAALAANRLVRFVEIG